MFHCDGALTPAGLSIADDALHFVRLSGDRDHPVMSQCVRVELGNVTSPRGLADGLGELLRRVGPIDGCVLARRHVSWRVWAISPSVDAPAFVDREIERLCPYPLNEFRYFSIDMGAARTRREEPGGRLHLVCAVVRDDVDPVLESFHLAGLRLGGVTAEIVALMQVVCSASLRSGTPAGFCSGDPGVAWLVLASGATSTLYRAQLLRDWDPVVDVPDDPDSLASLLTECRWRMSNPEQWFKGDMDLRPADHWPVDVEWNVLLVGGLARNRALRSLLAQELGIPVVCLDPRLAVDTPLPPGALDTAGDLTSAIGCALEGLAGRALWPGPTS